MKYFALTTYRPFSPALIDECVYMKGQCECVNKCHFQLFVIMKKNMRTKAVGKLFGCHAEETRSAAIEEYVWKNESYVDSRFEIGEKPKNRNNKRDWQQMYEDAKNGEIEKIPADVRIRCYNQFKRIEKDNLKPVGIEKECYYYYGKTRTGKSHAAWTPNPEAYPKDPRNKWWDGYNGQETVIIDEFSGQIGIEHMLRWLDKWPVTIETKGGAAVLKAKKIILTSNLSPEELYPEGNEAQKEALLARLKTVHFDTLVKY